MVNNEQIGRGCIFLLLSLLATLASCKRANKALVSTTSSPEPATLEFYTGQSDITNPNEYRYLYDTLPATIPELCQIVQGLLLHVMHAKRYGVNLTEQRKKEVRLRDVEDILQRAVELSNQPLIQHRDPDSRVTSHCRDYAVLLCSFLRHKGIPARVRAGYATYFDSSLHQTHWLCEYWCPDRMEWILVDAQLDDTQVKYYRVDFDPLRVPAGKFLYAGQEFRAAGGKDEVSYDIKRSLIQDLAALNKIEVEIWDAAPIMDMDEQQDRRVFLLLQQIADITTYPDDRLSDLQTIYNNHSELQISTNQNESRPMQ